MHLRMSARMKGEIIMTNHIDETKLCNQCSNEAMPGEEFCWECIIEDAITMGVIDKDLNYL